MASHSAVEETPALLPPGQSVGGDAPDVGVAGHQGECAPRPDPSDVDGRSRPLEGWGQVWQVGHLVVIPGERGRLPGEHAGQDLQCLGQTPGSLGR